MMMANEKRAPFAFLSEDFFDEGSFTETDAYLQSGSGIAEAVAGYGRVDDVPVYAFAQNTAVCGGAMSKAQAKKITKLYDSALKTGAPIVGFFDSIGGRLDEKFEMLAAYGDILKKSGELSGVVPRISVIMGDCYGASALIAASADFVIMHKDARLSLDPDSPEASAEANLKNGTAQFIAEDIQDILGITDKLIRYLPENNLAALPCDALVDGAFNAYPNPDKLPKYIADDDSLICVGSGEGICTALGKVDGSTVGFVVSHGEDISAADAQKIIRHVRFCDAFSIPLITLADAGKFESLRDSAALTAAYAEATAPKISVISGTAVGSVYIALAGTTSGADAVYALPDAIVSPIAPAAAAYLMDSSIADLPYADQAAAIDAYIRENLTAVKAAGDGYVDDIVEAADLRAKIIATLNMLASKRVATLPKKHSTII
jgi:acetyl-CoA carboxylase carboxyltransferase component